MTSIRDDFKEILRMVRPHARVLDVGCGEGELLELLTNEKEIDGQGLELSREGVAACLARAPRCCARWAPSRAATQLRP